MPELGPRLPGLSPWCQLETWGRGRLHTQRSDWRHPVSSCSRSINQTAWGLPRGSCPDISSRGRKVFVVSSLPDGCVRFEIVTISRPGDALVHRAGTVGRCLQRHATSGYLRILRRFVDRERQEGG